MNSGSTPARQPPRKLAWFALVVLIVLLLAGIALRYAMQPQHATRHVLDQVGRTREVRYALYRRVGGPAATLAPDSWTGGAATA